MLVIPVTKLPCGKVANYEFHMVHVEHLSFLEILHYLSLYPSEGSALEKFFYKYSLIRKKVYNADMLYLPDLYYIEFLLYQHYISSEFEFNFNYSCFYCGEDNRASCSANAVEFQSIESLNFVHEFSDGIILNFSYPRGEDIEKKLTRYLAKPYNDILNLDLVFLIIANNLFSKSQIQSENLVLGSTHIDAIAMLYVMKQLKSVIKPYEHVCKNCGRANYIDISSIVEIDIFKNSLDLDNLMKYKLYLSQQNIYPIEHYSLKEVISLYNLLSEEMASEDKIKIKLDEKGISYKS